MCPSGQWVMWHYGWVPIILSHHHAGLMSVEITMDIGNQNKLKRSYKFLEDSLKKINVLEDNIYYTRIEKKHLKHKFIQEIG